MLLASGEMKEIVREQEENEDIIAFNELERDGDIFDFCLAAAHLW